MGKPKIMVAVPCMETIPYQTVVSLMALQADAELHLEFISGSLVYDARNQFCEKAVNEGYDYLMFIDSDMTFPANTITTLLRHDADIATAVCYGRIGTHSPQVYVDMKPKGLFRKEPLCKRAENINGVFPIKACGMACCLIKTNVIRKAIKKYGYPFEPFGGLGEDFAFCYRINKLGAWMVADASIPIGHIGVTEYTAKDWVKDTPTPL